jgi:ubiquitin-protein ligase
LPCRLSPSPPAAYANGFFYFLLQMPPDYPTSPPRVRLQTTGGGAVRFNP